MPLLGPLHLSAAVLALISGAAVLVVRPKGARWHRRLGWIYVGAMLSVNATALLIYKLFGGFGPFHVAALISLVGIVFGTRAAVRARRSRLARQPFARAAWAERHYMWMTWSYVGLLAAFASETITRLPAFRPVLGGGRLFGVAVAGATLVIVAIGSRWIRAARVATLAPFRSGSGTTGESSSAGT